MALPPIVLLDPADYRRTPWKNGGGVTIDIAAAYRPGAEVGGWDGMLWRLGRTRIERPGPFSDLAGFDRLLAVIDGAGLILHPRGRAALDVRRRDMPVRFAGEWPIESDLTAGPVGVLNLLADRTAFAIDLAFPAPGAGVTIPPGIGLVLALGAAASVEVGGIACDLGPDAAARIDHDAPVRVTLRHGRVAVASVTTR